MPTPKQYYFAVNLADVLKCNTVALLDMLRYDAAKVLMIEGGVVVLNTLLREPTPGRWASFGIPIIYQESGRVGIINSYDVMREARASKGYREG